MTSGYLCLVLHAHLPFVRHPEFDDFLEEDWLYEAITETYLPLIDACERLLDEGIRFQLTLSITPTLAAMLEDPLLQDRYLRHVGRLCELSAREVERTRWLPEFHTLAVLYQQMYNRCRDAFENRHRRDLLGAFRRLSEAGALEIITSGATHGFLPLMLGRQNLWRAQILTAVRDHERHFGRPPAGIWLPECGFDPGLDAVLREAGLRFFFTDAHGVTHADPKPKHGVYAPILTMNGVAAFARDLESARQVWCAWLGYPGDFDYREFYRDVGWDLDYDYIRPYLHSDGKRTNVGIKYYRITGPTEEKQPYNFDRARARAMEHADHFLGARLRQTGILRRHMSRPPLVVSPYDAELFGHWWFEGPIWLESLLRRAAQTEEIETIHPSVYLERHGRLQVAMPSFSSWGLKGYAEHWLDGSNDWLYPHLHMAGERMVELANRFKEAGARRHADGADSEAAGITAAGEPGQEAGDGTDPLARSGNGIDPLLERGLNQAARELLLAQSSDWAFILKNGTMTEYATLRSRDHLQNFTRLYREILAHSLDDEWLRSLEAKNNLFPEMDYTVFADPD